MTRLSAAALAAAALWAAPGTGSASYVASVLADGPVGYWRLDETSGSTAFDSSGQGRHGTYVGAVAQGSVQSIAGASRSAEFGGGYVDLPDLWGGGVPAWSIEAWIRPTRPSAALMGIVSSTASFEFVHLQLSTSGGLGNTVAYLDNGPMPFDPMLQSPTREWRHVVLVVASGASVLYVNGAAFDTDARPINAIKPSHDVLIGNGFEKARPFLGNIQEVAIYQKALTANDVAEHYAAGTTPVPVPAALALLVPGLALLGGVARRRQSPVPL